MDEDPQDQEQGAASEAAVERAFGSENRNRLINRYFDQAAGPPTPANAWKHVYRLLLWSDPTTGLAHCYESDKSQPGKPWYARSLAFHDWLCQCLGVSELELAHEIDWLFIQACGDLSAAVLRKESRLAQIAAEQRRPYGNRAFPEPGSDPELAAILREALAGFLSAHVPDEVWLATTQRARQFLAVQNKRKNLVGEGFEDVLSQVVRRACGVTGGEIVTRGLLYQIPGFNRARTGGKENKVDVAIVRPSMRTIVTAKWSVRADREKQFPTEYEEYCNAESLGRKFQYVFVTNEFDPARLMRACDALFRNNLMFDHVVHINTDGVRAAYSDTSRRRGPADSKARVIEHIDNGRLISLETWLNMLVAQ